MPRGDRALLEAWRDGDRQAGGALIARHVDSLHRFFFNKVGGSTDVEELVQQTFTACVEGVDSFRGEASFRTWMFAIAHNRLRKWILAKQRTPTDLGETSVENLGVGPSTALAVKREQQLLLAGLRRIPFDSQVILELYYWEDMSAPQLAAALEIPVGTARSRLRKAKLELRAALDQLARTKEELESTVQGLEGWARKLRGRLE